MKRIASIAIYLAVIVILFEVVLRFAFPLPEISNFDRAVFVAEEGEPVNSYYRNRNYYWESSPDTGHRFILNYNGYGFRDSEWRVQKSDAKERVLFVGDSFLEGAMADQDQTIPVEFESASEGGFEILNAGMLGTDVSNYLQLIADMTPVYRPDAVIMLIYENDLRSGKIKIPEVTLSPVFHNLKEPRIWTLIKEWKRGYPVALNWFQVPIRILPKFGEPTFAWKD